MEGIINGRTARRSWREKYLRGHWNIGKHITIYGNNAMDWAVNIHTQRWGYVCFKIPLLARRRTYLYCSPNGTPWACTFYRGWETSERIRARIRKLNFGHNFDTEKHEAELGALDNRFSSFRITEYDIERYGDKPESE